MILVKKCNAIQLAHLYEHLFCMAVQDFFYDANVVPYLDYKLSGHTLNKGIIYIELTLYTEEARAEAKRLHEIKVPSDETSLATAATQIIAEKEKPFSSRGIVEIQRALEVLNRESWKDIDDLEAIDTKGMRHQIGAFYLAKGSPKPARKLTASIYLDPKFATAHREMLPLFFQLAALISEGFQADLASLFGFYGIDIDSTRGTKVVRLSHLFKVAYGSRINLGDVLDVMTGTVSGLHHHGGFKRLTADLQRASHNERGHNLPNVYTAFQDTGIFMGAKGWHKIATNENCALILKHMRIEVRFGRERRDEPVEPIVSMEPHPLTGPHARPAS